MAGSAITVLLKTHSAEENEMEAERVKRNLREKGFNDYAHSNGTNVITVLIKNKSRFAIRNALATIKQIGDFGFYYLIPDYLDEISDAIKDEEYFKAFTLGTALYESFGKNILIKHFKSKDLDPCRIENLNLHSVIIMLFTHKLIKEGLKSAMMSVKRTRNDLIHSYISTIESDEILNEIRENYPKLISSLEKLNEINEGTTNK